MTDYSELDSFLETMSCDSVLAEHWVKISSADVVVYKSRKGRRICFTPVSMQKGDTLLLCSWSLELCKRLYLLHMIYGKTTKRSAQSIHERTTCNASPEV